MMWQEVGVALIVCGAVLFLARRLFGFRAKKKKSTVTFVPLGSLKRDSSSGGGCH